jgi:hypothetical protein
MKLSDRVRIIHDGLPVDGVIVGMLEEFDAYDVRVGATEIVWNLPAKKIEPKETAS